ncbi:hypothetical protein HDV57DRAFT_518979 [Trichoderma longibrachiatum]
MDAVAHLLSVRCTETQESNTCEKPASQSGILIAVVITTGRRKIDKLEEASDPFELAAYGIEPPVAQRQRRRDYLRHLMGKR